jgi:hypothetical protein
MNDTHRMVIEARIRELLANRRWYRSHLWANWTDLRKEDDFELRALLKLARMARKLASEALDPMSAYGSFRDWSESELRVAAGNR